MVKIHYLEHDGTRHELEVAPGSTLMQGAVQNAIPGIEGDCGGACACATCHVYVPDAWRALTGEASAMEREMLECVNDYNERSRLACQIVVSPEMGGLTVEMPRSQR
jgi:ferredoxin, 2Fe-2S